MIKPEGEAESEEESKGHNSGEAETEHEESKEGVVIPEDFQQATHELLQKADTKHHLSHIRDRVYQKEDEMRQNEHKAANKNPKGKGKGPVGSMTVDPSIEG